MERNKLYNIEERQGMVVKRTFYENAPYPVCVVKKKSLSAMGRLFTYHIVPAA